jgi:hypothetical protein
MNTTTLFLHCQHFHEFEISFHETVDKLLFICDNGFIVENETREGKIIMQLAFLYIMYWDYNVISQCIMHCTTTVVF